MRYGELPELHKPVSRLIQGTLMLVTLEESPAFELLDAVYAQGCTAFDTAIVYGKGAAERRLGAWVRARGVRDSVVVIDKAAHPLEGRNRLTEADLEHDLRTALERLGFEQLDVLLLHRDDPEVPVSLVVDWMNRQIRAGRLRAYGASNWTHQRIEQANRYAADTGQLGFVASSPHFSLAEAVKSWPGCLSIAGDAGREARRWYRERAFPVMAWSPLSGGFLSGRVLPGAQLTQPVGRRVLEFYASDANFARLERLLELSRTRGVTPAELALAYVFSAGLELYATLGCESPREFAESVRALDLEMSAEQRAFLEA